MIGTSSQLGRVNGEDRLYSAVKDRRRHHHHRPSHRSSATAAAGGVSSSLAKDETLPVVSNSDRPEKLGAAKEGSATPVLASEAMHSGNLSRFLESTTPAVPADYPSKVRTRGWSTSSEEVRPYFNLCDLWESFKEWSAYGAGVPLLLNGRDSVVQYYVPSLSGIQLYGDSIRPSLDYSRRPGDDSDSEYSRDSSSSDGSSNCQHDKGRNCSSNHFSRVYTPRMGRSSFRMKHMQQQGGSSSDDSDSGNSQGHLLFEFLEQDPPFIREPLSDKILDLAQRFPALNTLRSCDLLPSSWLSVAWYPIYRIPTGPTLKDLDACFLTFHSLSTMAKDCINSPDPITIHPVRAGDSLKVSLPTFGLASYKFKGSIWIPNGGSELQLANSLLQAADNWLEQFSVYHPDYRFFVSHGRIRR